MICENIFCIYFNDEECLLDEISLDIQGNCQSCIYIDFDEEFLNKKRQEDLEKLKGCL